jgi:hypothetical protein
MTVRWDPRECEFCGKEINYGAAHACVRLVEPEESKVRIIWPGSMQDPIAAAFRYVRRVYGHLR